MNTVYSPEQLRGDLLEVVYTPVIITLFADALFLKIVSQAD